MRGPGNQGRWKQLPMPLLKPKLKNMKRKNEDPITLAGVILLGWIITLIMLLILEATF